MQKYCRSGSKLCFNFIPKRDCLYFNNLSPDFDFYFQGRKAPVIITLTLAGASYAPKGALSSAARHVPGKT
jgi:hypothetical protein